jgi:hypothetical protein
MFETRAVICALQKIGCVLAGSDYFSFKLVGNAALSGFGVANDAV